MLCVPKPGSRIGLDDPICRVKTTEMLTTEQSEQLDGVGNFEGRKQVLYSQCEKRLKTLPQSE